MLRVPLGLGFLLMSSWAAAQPAWTLRWSMDNDFFGDWFDRDYSFGSRIDLVQPFSLTLLPNANAISYSYVIEGYTNDQPGETGAELGPDDHPFAGYQGIQVQIGFQRRVGSDLSGGDSIWGYSYGLELGLVGPQTGIDGVQRSFHSAIGAAQYQGWDAQLPNETVFNLYTRHELHLVFDSLSAEQLRLTPYLDLGLGTKSTYLGGGFDASYGTHEPLNASVASLVTHAVADQERMGWSVYGAVRLRYVSHDLFLDGTVNTQAPHTVERSAAVYDAELGVEVLYGRWSLGWKQVHMSRRFKAQENDGQRFGKVYLEYSF